MPKHIITVDLGYGDSGKGTIVDWLAREHGSNYVVRYNGGAQAFHTVYSSSRERHIFRQFGSGLLAGTKTIIGPEVVINPMTMVREADELKDLRIYHALDLVEVDSKALVATPYHRALNCIRETLRGVKHGSTGMGIGEARRISLQTNRNLAIRVEDIAQPGLDEKLDNLLTGIRYEASQLLILTSPDRDVLRTLKPEFDILDGKIAAYTVPQLTHEYKSWHDQVHVHTTDYLRFLISSETVPVIFEGAHGLLLDKQHGWHPHTTWSDTTPRHALELLDPNVAREIIGISRTYATRHGAGPLVTEDQISREVISDDDNPAGKYQGALRTGCLDMETLSYALEVCKGVGAPVSKLAFTHCDKLGLMNKWPVCVDYKNGPDIPLRCYSCTEEASTEASLFTEKLKYSVPVVVQHETYRVLDDVSCHLETPIMVKSFGKTSITKLKLC